MTSGDTKASNWLRADSEKNVIVIDTKMSLIEGEIYIQKVIYHEFSHALHYSVTHGKVITRFVNHAYQEVQKKYENQYSELNELLKKERKSIDGSIRESKGNQEKVNKFKGHKQLLSSIEDTLAALTSGDYGRGHEHKTKEVEKSDGTIEKKTVKTYWEKGKQQAEFFAHATEFRYMPSMYESMINESQAWSQTEKELIQQFVSDVEVLTYETDQGRLRDRNTTLIEQLNKKK